MNDSVIQAMVVVVLEAVDICSHFDNRLTTKVALRLIRFRLQTRRLIALITFTCHPQPSSLFLPSARLYQSNRTSVAITPTSAVNLYSSSTLVSATRSTATRLLRTNLNPRFDICVVSHSVCLLNPNVLLLRPGATKSAESTTHATDEQTTKLNRQQSGSQKMAGNSFCLSLYLSPHKSCCLFRLFFNCSTRLLCFARHLNLVNLICKPFPLVPVDSLSLSLSLFPSLFTLFCISIKFNCFQLVRFCFPLVKPSAEGWWLLSKGRLSPGSCS
jgi:hypothetical protein